MLNTQTAAETLLGLGAEGTYGKDHPNWLSFLNDFSSKGRYEKRVQIFLDYHAASNKDTLEESLPQYFDESYELLNSDGNKRYAATTLRGWLSIFVAFWQYTGRGNLHHILPVLEKNISKWEKKQKTKKTHTFTKEELSKYTK